MSDATPGQTVGPFYGFALPYEGGPDLVPKGHPDAIRLHGVVRDGAGAPVPDALLEIRQADQSGDVPRKAGSLRRDGYTFTGWGRASTDNVGEYSFTTVTPGAPFIAMTVFARGLMNRLFTRVYLPGASDEFLLSLPPDRRETLVAEKDGDGLRFDVTLQGDRETVFITYPGHS
ncbi:MAG: protocatechuate 3,4-dioxygenase subunit alpha [Actinomycetota bacterium]|nr:protocatechuate 3,4-dioxygenase subunit alpha [Actinomycetota bacterium]